MVDENSKTVSIGEFCFDTSERTLARNGESVPLPPKAAELLALLIEKHGQVVTRDELLATVWKDTFVEEGNINYTVSLLRKALAKDMIQTVPRRGYKLITTISPDQPPNGPVLSALSPRLRIFAAAAVLVIFGLGIGVVFYLRNSSTAASPAQRDLATLAVLRLKNLTEDAADDSVILGLTDSLITRLAGLRRFKVRPFSAVEQYAKGKRDAIALGSELKCDAVIAGTYQRTGDRMRVNLRLIDVRDGSQLWTYTFDEPNADIFALQDQLALRVAGSLIESITQNDEEILGKRYTENREAYLAYLRGRTIFSRRVENGFQQSLDAYQQALALDPAFALAYSGLGDLFSNICRNSRRCRRRTRKQIIRLR